MLWPQSARLIEELSRRHDVYRSVAALGEVSPVAGDKQRAAGGRGLEVDLVVTVSQTEEEIRRLHVDCDSLEFIDDREQALTIDRVGQALGALREPRRRPQRRLP